MSKVYQQIGDFQKHFREYFIGRLVDSGFDPSTLQKDRRETEAWQLEFWDFKNFIINNKEVFRADFGAKVNNLPTWLDDLREIRNKLAHFVEVTQEDEKEAEILIKKIAGFAKLSIDLSESDISDYQITSVRQFKDSSGRKRHSDPDLESILIDFPSLSMAMTESEYKVRRNDLGVGSMWIKKQRDGYRLVTTGNAHCVDSELEKLTGRTPKTWDDRYHCGWNSLGLETIRKIFFYYSNF